MSKTTPSTKQPPTSTDNKSTNGQSASQKADKEAKKGRPLTAENMKERSPKQENL